MKKLFFSLIILLGAFILPRADLALAKAHFTPGGSGYMLATMPPPGLFYLMYNVWYQADDYYLNDGKKLRARDADTKVFTQTHRLVWSTPVEILSGNLMFDIVIPVTNYSLGRDLVGPNGDQHHFGIGDPHTHVTIAWHRPKFDALASVAVHWPIGDYREGETASPGLGYFGLQPTVGLTWYFDEAKTWTWSTVLRYEISYKQRHTDMREGNNFHMESSIGKKLGDIALAVSTAGSWQTTNSRGKPTLAANDQRTTRFALGPEFVVGLGRWGSLSFRCLFDVLAHNNPKGTMSVVTWSVPVFITQMD
ncbi:MAG: transporter [Deltaproteobacteria bacterium]|nr:transporter [Deltaproteobacteria bacterium]